MKLACPSHQRTMSASRAPPNSFSSVLLICLLESQRSEKVFIKRNNQSNHALCKGQHTFFARRRVRGP